VAAAAAEAVAVAVAVAVEEVAAAVAERAAIPDRFDATSRSHSLLRHQDRDRPSYKAPRKKP